MKPKDMRAVCVLLSLLALIASTFATDTATRVGLLVVLAIYTSTSFIIATLCHLLGDKDDEAPDKKWRNHQMGVNPPPTTPRPDVEPVPQRSKVK